MKKLPIGIQTFSEIIQENHCYVDKTPQIKLLTNSGKYYFLSRPRRFGKSLLISTLAAAFSGQKDLFKGLYLEKNWAWDNVYPVIQLSYGRGVVRSLEELVTLQHESLRECAQRYDIKLNNTSVAGQFAELIQQLQHHFQQRVVVLIDEYDKPILDNINRPDIAIEIREGLKNFYSVIKDSDAYIRFAFLTGVSKFSKVSLFSGLNNLLDISLDARYATLCGYTEPDIGEIFADYLHDVDFNQLRTWYNGYNFAGEKVYNPYDVLLYLDQKLFKNYWFETGSPTFLIKLIQQRCYSIPNLEHIEVSDSFLSSFDVHEIEIETLLFQTGYLTIKSIQQQGSRKLYQLTYPNLEVKMSLTESLLNAFARPPLQRERNMSAVYKSLQTGDMLLLEKTFQAFFASIPHAWYRKNQIAGYEGYYASIVYCYFAALGLEVIAEDCSSHGQLDLTVCFEKKVFLLEFKVSAKAAPALAQIKTKGYQQKYLHQGLEIYLIGVSFDAEQRNIVGFEWERLSE